MALSTQHYIDRLKEIASRVGRALPEQTIADLKEVVTELEEETRPTSHTQTHPCYFTRHIP